MSTTNETPRKVRLLRNLRINEVSAVDRGAGEGVKIVLMKRDDEPPRSKPHVERAERAGRIERRRREREEFEKTWARPTARGRSMTLSPRPNANRRRSTLLSPITWIGIMVAASHSTLAIST